MVLGEEDGGIRGPELKITNGGKNKGQNLKLARKERSRSPETRMRGRSTGGSGRARRWTFECLVGQHKEGQTIAAKE